MSSNPPIVSATGLWPQRPRTQSDLMNWATGFAAAVEDRYAELAGRLNDEIFQGTLAQRPSARGTRRLFFATDLAVLYYDAGAAGWLDVANTPAYAAVSPSDALTATGGPAAFSGGGSQFTVPAGQLRHDGLVCRIEYFGVYTTDGTPGRTLALTVRLAGNNLLATTLTMATSATNLPFFMFGEFTVRTLVGANPTIAVTGCGAGAAGGGATGFAVGAPGARTYSQDLSAPLLVDATGNWSAGAQSATIDGLKVYVNQARAFA